MSVLEYQRRQEDKIFALLKGWKAHCNIYLMSSAAAVGQSGQPRRMFKARLALLVQNRKDRRA